MLERRHSSILSTFSKLPVPVVIKTFILSIFECPFYTGFTVRAKTKLSNKTVLTDMTGMQHMVFGGASFLF